MADQTRYVNTASTTGGDGTTNATVGANRAYASIVAAVADANSNKSADDKWTILCSGTPETISGYVYITAAKNITGPVVIQANTGNFAGASWDNTKYGIVGALSLDALIYFDGGFVQFIGIQLEQQGGTYPGWCLGALTNDNDGTIVDKCFLLNSNIGTTPQTEALILKFTWCDTSQITNTAMVVRRKITGDFICKFSYGTMKVYNCTFLNGLLAIQVSTGQALTVKNCLFLGCDAVASDAFNSASDYNATDLASANTNFGTHSLTSASVALTSLTSPENITETAGDDTIGVGVNVSGDFTPVSGDWNSLTGITRTAWDIGAAEGAGGEEEEENAITLESPTTLTFYQSTTGTGDIPITGSFTGTPNSIEARFNSGSWGEIDPAPTSHAFSGTLEDQAEGIGLLEVRFSNDTGITDSVDNIGIGNTVGGAGTDRVFNVTFFS